MLHFIKEMYPLDRRQLAQHVYTLLSSLRKTAIILQVSHTTVSRWLKYPERKAYDLKIQSKSKQVVQTIKAIIMNDPFVSVQRLKDIINSTFPFSVSSELVRTVILKSGLSRKKCRFFSEPTNQKDKIVEFIKKRDDFKQQGRQFVSLDETSFGRNGIITTGYALKGQRLYVKKNVPRITTTSVIAVASHNGFVATRQVNGSFNTILFGEFLESLQLQQGTVILLDNVAFHHSKQEDGKNNFTNPMLPPPP
jgi:transposase